MIICDYLLILLDANSWSTHIFEFNINLRVKGREKLMDVGGGKKECIIEIKNCIELSGRWMSRGHHCDQLAPRQ